MKKRKEDAISLPEPLKDGSEKLLLHACCAPCSSAIVEWLIANGVRPIIFYFNPNIWPRAEYEIRKSESKRHAESLGLQWIDGDYDHDVWCRHVAGMEDKPERGARCEMCFGFRLTATARKAQELGIRYFATTLASSRWKSLEQINRAGLAAEQTVNGICPSIIHPQPSITHPQPSSTVEFWAQNWRKGGLQERRNQLLREYQFYNQQYCGCEFSLRSAAPSKELLRKVMREMKRRFQAELSELSADTIEFLKDFISSLATLGNPPSCDTFLAYWPLPDEVDIRPFIDELVAQGKTVLLPRVTGEETMELCRYTSRADLREGTFHIMEPVGELFTDYDQIDVALIPGMAFDMAGHRLGRGKGYYDRFLAEHLVPCKARSRAPRLVGVCFPFQCVAKLPCEDHDVAVDDVVRAWPFGGYV